VLSINHDRVPFLKRTRILINWGNSEPYPYKNCRVINNPEAVALASNKIRTFNYWSNAGVSCPEWTTSFDQAESWVNDGATVFCRTRVQAHSGDGIVIATNPDELVSSGLYTKYIKKKKEFRVHVFNKEIIDIQEKRRSMGSSAGFLIRNHANGFVFCRDNIIEPTDLRDVAIQAVTSLGLDFGAVDVIYNEHYDKCYALEVNTAPGLEGTTLQSYINKFSEVAYG
jgi:glutathione synthase/RimK-type ligase-like ATP-grasp enzyme